ncbi:MAG: hypothetical protein ABH867_05245 [Patescibacteria group bacterium]
MPERYRPNFDDWPEKARSPEKIAALMEDFEKRTGFSFQTPFSRLGGITITPELLTLRKEEVPGGTLNCLEILRHMLLGHVIIYPFNPDQLGMNSYDVRLGEYYYTAQEALSPAGTMMAHTKQLVKFPKRYEGVDVYPLYNPQDRENSRRIWGSQFGSGWCKAMSFRHYVDHFRPLKQPTGDLDERDPDSTFLIVIPPAQTILAHTHEFIGGRVCVYGSLRARSTSGRQLLTVCDDAGLGDVGYIGRWTLEIRNKSDVAAQLLVVGNTYAQMVFERTGTLPEGISYTAGGGNYQASDELQALINNWKPENMLPKPIRMTPLDIRD